MVLLIRYAALLIVGKLASPNSESIFSIKLFWNTQGTRTVNDRHKMSKTNKQTIKTPHKEKEMVMELRD